MKYIVTIDGGTTNTRVSLVENGAVLEKVSLGVGVRDTKEIGKGGYAAKIAEGIAAVCKKRGIAREAVAGVFASGMITSDLGLLEIPHIPLPVGRERLAGALVTEEIPPIGKITFVPGLRTNPAELIDRDMMRGEEAELFGILSQLDGGCGVILLPGSHCKCVTVEDGVITDFLTTLSGEMARAVSENTILRDAVADGFTKNANAQMLLLGYDTAVKLGMTAALFKVRVLSKQNSDLKPQDLYSFLLGGVLSCDVLLAERIAKSKGFSVAVAGSEPFKTALCTLLSARTSVCVKAIPESISENAAASGISALLE